MKQKLQSFKCLWEGTYEKETHLFFNFGCDGRRSCGWDKRLKT